MSGVDPRVEILEQALEHEYLRGGQSEYGLPDHPPTDMAALLAKLDAATPAPSEAGEAEALEAWERDGGALGSGMCVLRDLAKNPPDDTGRVIYSTEARAIRKAIARLARRSAPVVGWQWRYLAGPNGDEWTDWFPARSEAEARRHIKGEKSGQVRPLYAGHPLPPAPGGGE